MSNITAPKEHGYEDSPVAIKKYRVQLDYSPKDFAKINALVKELHLGTRAELFRSALLAFQWVYSKKKQGCTIVAITPEGRYLEPEFAFTQSIEQPAGNDSVNAELCVGNV